MCPHCHGEASKVTETRRHEGVVYRRRRCLTSGCKRGFITKETSSLRFKFPQAILDAAAERLRDWQERHEPKEHNGRFAAGLNTPEAISAGAALASVWGRNPVDQ